MSSYKTHQIFALLLVVLLLFLSYKYDLFSFTTKQVVIACLIVLVYSILPDIDTPSGKLRRIFTPAILFLALIAIIIQLYFVALIAVLVLLFLSFLKHRGRLHSLAAALAFSLPLMYYDIFFCIFALIGYISHLVLDKQMKLV